MKKGQRRGPKEADGPRVTQRGASKGKGAEKRTITRSTSSLKYPRFKDAELGRETSVPISAVELTFTTQ